MHNPKAVLFDLDGTLLDTASDLANALNHVRRTENLPPLPLAKIRHVASDGARGLLQLGLQIEETHARFNVLRDRLLTYYANHIADNTRLFPGMEKVLQRLEAQKIPWGIVTNKPTALTQALLDTLALTQRTACIVCGDTLPQRKPHPAPLLHAAALLAVAPADACYVGDAARDIEAARAAGMSSVGALYGYLHTAVRPELWQADRYIQAPAELLDALGLNG